MPAPARTEMLTEADVVCLALRAWDTPRKNNQQVMTALARTNRVLYVNPPRAFRDALTEVRGGSAGHAVVEVIAGSLSVYHGPWPLSPVRHDRVGAPAVNGVIHGLRAAHLRRTCRRLGFAAPVLWVYDPMTAPMLGSFREKLVVYHVIDNYDEYFPASATRLRALMTTRQRTLLKRADVVFAVSEPLAQRCREINPNTHMVPNGVDYRLFAGALGTAWMPPDVAAIPRPVVGYVGVVQPRVDFALLREVAVRRRDWSLLIVGPTEYLGDREEFGLLVREPNVYYVGPKRAEEIPHYIKACDVGLIPYRHDAFSPYSDSLKLYEYLACGRPVVSSDMPSSRRFVPLVAIAGTAVEFIGAIEAGLEEDGARKAERLAVAESQSWERRADVMRELVGEALDRKRARTDRRTERVQRPMDMRGA